jgi:hypothetical protein
VGIFDPTGLVDLVNGVSYVKQGDYIFGFLSMVSAVPYIGDVAAKPLLGSLKLGKPVTKTLDTALKLSKAGKTAEAVKIIEDLSKTSSITKKFVDSVVKWGPKLKEIITKLVGSNKLTKGLSKLLNDWVELFLSAAQRSQVSRYAIGKLAKKGTNLTSKEIMTLKDSLKGSGLFKGYKMSDPGLTYKFFNLTSGYLWRNPSLRALATKTKTWLGFLDFLGLGNFVGPDELSKTMDENEINQKFQDYLKTPQAQEYVKSDFPDDLPPVQTASVATKSDNNSTTSNSSDPLSFLIKNIF